jgi:hypothetical protein
MPHEDASGDAGHIFDDMLSQLERAIRNSQDANVNPSFGVVLVREENTMLQLGGYQKPYWIIVLGAIIILLLISLAHL